MSNHSTASELIHDLRTSLLWQIAQHSEDHGERFAAFAAFINDDPAQLLRDLAALDKAAMPDNVRALLKRGAEKVSRQLCL